MALLSKEELALIKDVIKVLHENTVPQKLMGHIEAQDALIAKWQADNRWATAPGLRSLLASRDAQIAMLNARMSLIGDDSDVYFTF